MYTLDLSSEEALRIYQSCVWLRLHGPRRISLALLKDFIVSRLAKEEPSLASKVEQLREAEFGELYADLKNRQWVADHLLYG